MELREKIMEAACNAIIKAYDEGEQNGGSIEWSDLDHACETAREAMKQPKETSTLREAANLVVLSWDSGDLAGAVNALRSALETN